MSGSDDIQGNAPTALQGDQDRSHAVGYGKPPAHSRFRRGQSGNPKGRPKGSKGVRGLVNSALDETVRVAENGRPRAIKKRQAILLSMIAKAIKGDVRAAALVMRLMETHDPAPQRPDGQLSHEDWLELLSDDQIDYAIGQLTQSLDDVAVANRARATTTPAPHSSGGQRP